MQRCCTRAFAYRIQFGASPVSSPVRFCLGTAVIAPFVTVTPHACAAAVSGFAWIAYAIACTTIYTVFPSASVSVVREIGLMRFSVISPGATGFAK